MEPAGLLQPSPPPPPPPPPQSSSSLPSPALSALPRRRGLTPSRDTPESRGDRAQAPKQGAGPERTAPEPGLWEPVPDSTSAAGMGRRRPVPVRSLPRTSSGATSGAHVGPGGPGPSPGSRGADPGKGAGDPGSASLFPCSPPGAWPGPDSASARPCAPPHTRAHTLTLPRALSHTHSPPSSSVYLLQLSGDPGEVPHCACATQSPRRPRVSRSAATLRRWRSAVS